MDCHTNNLTVIQCLVTVVAQVVRSTERADLPGVVLRVWVSKVPDSVRHCEDEVGGNQGTTASIEFFVLWVYHGGVKGKLVPNCVDSTNDPFLILIEPPLFLTPGARIWRQVKHVNYTTFVT